MKLAPLPVLIATMTLAVLGGAVVAGARPASAGHPQGSESNAPGDCVGSHGYVSCWDWYVPHAGTRDPLYMRSVRQTDNPMYWDPFISAAEQAWDVDISGPQFFSTTSHAEETFVYYKTALPGQDPLGKLPSEGGVVYKCAVGFGGIPPCTSLSMNGVWQWAEIYLDAFLPTYGIDDRDVHVIAHEIGHVLLLTHHNDGNYDNFPLMEQGYDLVNQLQDGPTVIEEGSTSPPCNVKRIEDYVSSGVRCIFQYYSSYAPDLVVTTAPGSSSPAEGGSPSFSVTVKNQGTSAAGAFAVQLKFNGSARPYPQGVCAFNSGLAVAATQSCTTNSVDADFPGGPIVATVDYAGQVAESNEGNNTKSGGTLGVVPKAATSLFIAPPYAAYGYTDNSAFETGFGIKLQRKVSTCSGTTGWSTFSQPLNAPISGTGQAVTIAPFSPVLRGYCYRVKVTTLGPYANSSERTSSTVWYP